MAILKTRLYKPSVKKKFVIRDRLFAKLNEELDRPLKLIVAGAGYGKSVLMSQWLDTYDKKYCWISLEEDCNELHIFLSYFIAGIQQQFPEGMQHTAKLNSSNIMPSGEVIGQLLNNDLQALPESLFIVLDDFHVIRNKIITAIFNQIISFPPENVQIALISRLDPPLNKTKLQAYQKICEIRMSDLRFSVNEIVKVAKQSFEIEMDEGVASHIEEGTEGWALSVYLKIREFVFKDPATAEKSTEYDHAGTLTPFLFNLIEAALPPGTERLLLVTALFDRFDLELIKRVLGENGDTSVMHEDLGFALQKLNKLGSPLLIGLDDEKKWFRLHHFIREILYKRLVQINSTDQIEKYYRVAGLYFADQGCYEEGIKYAKLGNDLETAVNIIESGCDRLMDKGENLRLQRWLDMIPVTTLSTNPLLQVISAYLCDTIYYDYGAMRNYMDQAAKYLDDKNSYRRLLGAYAAVHACLSAQEKNLPDALQWADRALDTLLPEQKFLRDYVLNYKVLATSMVRSAAEAQALINNLEIISKPPDNRRLLRIKVIKLMFDWTQANHRNLKLSGKIVVDIGKQEGVWWLYKMGCYYMSQYYYLKNQIDGVYACVDSGIECFFNGGPAWTLQLYFAGVLAAVAENDLAKADAYLKDANKFVETNNLEAYTGYLRAFEVELALKTNDVESAWRLHRTAKYATHPPFKFYYIPQFTQIKLYIAKGDPDLMREAHFLIEEYKKMTGNLAYAKIQIMLLEAVWFEKSHLNERAEKALAEALMLVPEDEYIRVFLDMGEPVYKMMLALPEKQKQTHLVRNILMAFKYEIKLQPAISGHFNLTSKEMELMEMVASGMQNKEIASQLFLSNTTIKTYLYRIYQKLEVKNRLSAIRKIRDIQSSR